MSKGDITLAVVLSALAVFCVYMAFASAAERRRRGESVIFGAAPAQIRAKAEAEAAARAEAEAARAEAELAEAEARTARARAETARAAEKERGWGISRTTWTTWTRRYEMKTSHLAAAALAAATLALAPAAVGVTAPTAYAGPTHTVTVTPTPSPSKGGGSWSMDECMKHSTAQECANIAARRNGTPPPFKSTDPHGGIGALTQGKTWLTILAFVAAGVVGLLLIMWALGSMAKGAKEVGSFFREAAAEEEAKRAKAEAEANAAARAEEDRRAERERAEAAKSADREHGWGHIEDYLDYVDE